MFRVPPVRGSSSRGLAQAEPLLLWQAARALVMHALAELPAAALGEEADKVGPGSCGELFRRVRGIRKFLRWHESVDPPRMVSQKPWGKQKPECRGVGEAWP